MPIPRRRRTAGRAGTPARIPGALDRDNHLPRVALAQNAPAALHRGEGRRVARRRSREARAVGARQHDVERFRDVRRDRGLHRERVRRRHDPRIARPPHRAVAHANELRRHLHARRAVGSARPPHRRAQHVLGAEQLPRLLRTDGVVLHGEDAAAVDHPQPGQSRQLARHRVAQARPRRPNPHQPLRCRTRAPRRVVAAQPSHLGRAR